MTQEPKIIRAKLGLLELAKQLGNVSRACREGLGWRTALVAAVEGPDYRPRATADRAGDGEDFTGSSR